MLSFVSKKLFPFTGPFSLRKFPFTLVTASVQKNIDEALPPKVETAPLGKLLTQTSKRNIKRQTRSLRQWNIWAYATAKSYSLKNLTRFIENERLYTVKPFGPTDLHDDCSLVRLKNENTVETASNSLNIREFFVFDEGAIVFWNFENEERLKIIRSLARFAEEPLNQDTIEEEAEKLFYKIDESIENSHFRLRPYEDLFLKSGADDDENILERYTVSNAMVASAKVT